jgi:hypothetical protein
MTEFSEVQRIVAIQHLSGPRLRSASCGYYLTFPDFFIRYPSGVLYGAAAPVRSEWGMGFMLFVFKL